MKKRLALFGGMAVVWSAISHAGSDEVKPCLDYWAVGKSGCESMSLRKKSPPLSPTVVVTSPVVAPSPTATIGAPPSTLDSKIDDFLKNHGKPPREFVAFYLDPTPENAMKWAHTYNDMLDRNVKLAVAWEQAEQMYNYQVSKGANPAQFASTTLPTVPDFGVPIPGFTSGELAGPAPASTGQQIVNAVMGGFGGAAGGLNRGVPAINLEGIPNGLVGGGNGGISNLSGIPSVAGALHPPVAGSIDISKQFKGTITDIPTNQQLGLTYYFSAVCPYCKKFEPEFKRLMTSLPDSTRVTCVDVTPLTATSAPSEQNLAESKLNCEWRTPQPGETEQLGIRQTPSLLVSRGPGRPLERITGYVEPDKLKIYLLTGRAE